MDMKQITARHLMAIDRISRLPEQEKQSAIDIESKRHTQALRDYRTEQAFPS